MKKEFLKCLKKNILIISCVWLLIGQTQQIPNNNLYEKSIFISALKNMWENLQFSENILDIEMYTFCYALICLVYFKNLSARKEKHRIEMSLKHRQNHLNRTQLFIVLLSVTNSLSVVENTLSKMLEVLLILSSVNQFLHQFDSWVFR